MRQRNVLVALGACLAALVLTAGSATADTDFPGTPSPICPAGSPLTPQECATDFANDLQQQILSRVCQVIGRLPRPKALPATITAPHAGVLNNLAPLGLRPAMKQAFDQETFPDR